MSNFHILPLSEEGNQVGSARSAQWLLLVKVAPVARETRGTDPDTDSP